MSTQRNVKEHIAAETFFNDLVLFFLILPMEIGMYQ